jgi:hypothetical protein
MGGQDRESNRKLGYQQGAGDVVITYAPIETLRITNAPQLGMAPPAWLPLPLPLPLPPPPLLPQLTAS